MGFAAISFHQWYHILFFKQILFQIFLVHIHDL
jgi:hypothetical protein